MLQTVPRTNSRSARSLEKPSRKKKLDEKGKKNEPKADTSRSGEGGQRKVQKAGP